jgi:hypothetical protein
MQKIVFLLLALTIFLSGCEKPKSDNYQKWSKEQANEWYKKTGWLRGCNFIPSTAINQLEMWQQETFDAETINRELGWAADLGFNSMRVYLHNLAWEADVQGLKNRINKFLEIAARHNISIMFVLLDDCWGQNPRIGKQPDPIPGVHNSGWLQSPGIKIVTDSLQWQNIETYVKDIISTFANDERIILWDLYNEPGNNGLINKSLPLLKSVFRWAREAGPTQPISVAVWNYKPEFASLNILSIAQSDIVTFHHYASLDLLEIEVNKLRGNNLPLICTEWMARTNNSRFETHFPYFKENNISCYSWGFVNGKTQTIYPWGSLEGSPEPEIWFHDILRKDGIPFDINEIKIIKNLTNTK